MPTFYAKWKTIIPSYKDNNEKNAISPKFKCYETLQLTAIKKKTVIKCCSVCEIA